MGATHVTVQVINPADPTRVWEGRVTSTVIFSDDDTEPILGLTALESVGIEVDPKDQRLKRLPAVRLKS